MPHLELTTQEAKLLWLILDQRNSDRDAGLDLFPETAGTVEVSLFDKAYRAYRGMPPREAA